MLDLHRTSRRNLSIAGRAGDGILLRTVAAGMTQWLRRELVLTDDGLEWDAWSCQRLVKRTMPYDVIAAVDVLWGPFADDVRVSGKGGADSLLVLGLDKASAARVKSIVDRRISVPRAA